jgi:hypothetical protein
VTDYNNVHEALMALASEDKREEYARRLEQQINAPRKDKFGGIIDDLAELQAPLMKRLREKLTRGEWIAEGFGHESGQPIKIHPRLWQSLTINAWANMAGDRFQQVGGKSRTGFSTRWGSPLQSPSLCPWIKPLAKRSYAVSHGFLKSLIKNLSLMPPSVIFSTLPAKDGVRR